MAKGFTARLEGLAEFKSGIKRYAELIQKDVDTGLNKAGNEIVTDAKARCIVPSIAAGISIIKAQSRYEITTQGEESAYLEFGTGNYAKALLGPYPKDWVDMAMTFFINGLGRTPASPYLYPPFQQNAGEAVLEIADKIAGH